MIRANNVIVGTSSAGSGPFTATAAPTALGALDIYTAMAGQGFGTSQPVPVPLVLTEYTDSTFVTPKQKMGFIGGVTLGANLGATSIAVATVLWTQTGLNTSTPTYTISSPAAITVGTAANTLIEIDATVDTLYACPPYWNATDFDKLYPFSNINATNGTFLTASLTSGQELFNFFDLKQSFLAVRYALHLSGGQVGGTSTAYGRIYARGSNGRPGKLVADFGVLGTSGSSLIAPNNSVVTSAALASPPLLSPGPYAASFYTVFSGATTPPKLVTGTPMCDSGWGTLGGSAVFAAYASSPSNPAPDPANTTGFALTNSVDWGGMFPLIGGLRSS